MLPYMVDCGLKLEVTRSQIFVNIPYRLATIVVHTKVLNVAIYHYIMVHWLCLASSSHDQ